MHPISRTERCHKHPMYLLPCPSTHAKGSTTAMKQTNPRIFALDRLLRTTNHEPLRQLVHRCKPKVSCTWYCRGYRPLLLQTTASLSTFRCQTVARILSARLVLYVKASTTLQLPNPKKQLPPFIPTPDPSKRYPSVVSP